MAENSETDAAERFRILLASLVRVPKREIDEVEIRKAAEPKVKPGPRKQRKSA
jgi:hypothetical protein